MTEALLLLGNDMNILYLLRRYAEESRFDTTCLSPGEDAVAVAQQIKPAAIILQAELLREQDVLSRLKKSAATRSIPVVSYVGLIEETSQPMVGVAGCLCDPVSYGDFLAALENIGISPGGLSP